MEAGECIAGGGISPEFPGRLACLAIPRRHWHAGCFLECRGRRL